MWGCIIVRAQVDMLHEKSPRSEAPSRWHPAIINSIERLHFHNRTLHIFDASVAEDSHMIDTGPT